MANWVDTSDDDSIEFQCVEPGKVLGMLWYYDDEDKWYLERTTQVGDRLYSDRLVCIAPNEEAAKEWADNYIEEAVDSWPTIVDGMKTLR